MHKYELDSIMLKGCSCDELENSVLCDLLCDTKYLLHSSQNPKISLFLCVGMPTTSNTTILLLAVFFFVGCVNRCDDPQ